MVSDIQIFHHVIALPFTSNRLVGNSHLWHRMQDLCESGSSHFTLGISKEKDSFPWNIFALNWRDCFCLFVSPVMAGLTGMTWQMGISEKLSVELPSSSSLPMSSGLMIIIWNSGQKQTSETLGFKNFGSIAFSAGWKGLRRRTASTTRLATVSRCMVSFKVDKAKAPICVNCVVGILTIICQWGELFHK